MARKKASSRKKKASKKPKAAPKSKKTPKPASTAQTPETKTGKIDEYDYQANDIGINVLISKKKGEYVPVYEVSLAQISETTELIS